MSTGNVYKLAIKRVFANKYHDKRMAVYWGRDDDTIHVIRSGIDQPHPVRVARSLDGAGGWPPVKRFAALLRQVGNKVRRGTECAKLNRRTIEWPGDERT
jgi:hypothetical protein